MLFVVPLVARVKWGWSSGSVKCQVCVEYWAVA